MTERFSLRRVNPFLGAVAVVKTDAGRAVSLDGRRWQLQVLAHPPRALWSRAGEQTAMQSFRFGLRSEARGLSRVPLNPMLDVGRMVATAHDLVEQVRAGLDRLPFPFAPEPGLWLLDQQRAPLALLATAREDTDLDAFSGAMWNAGGRGEHPFVSSALTERGVAGRGASGRHHHAAGQRRAVH